MTQEERFIRREFINAQLHNGVPGYEKIAANVREEEQMLRDELSEKSVTFGTFTAQLTGIK